MIKWYPLWFLVVPFFAWAQADEITYKGVPLGASIEEYKAKLPDHKCSTTECIFIVERECSRYDQHRLRTSEELKDCYERNSFGGAFPQSVFSSFRDGKLVQFLFTFPTGNFFELTAALKERLREATKVVDQPIQTRAGVQLQNREMTWERPGMLLIISRYGASVDQMFARITTPEEQMRRLEEFKTKTKIRAKDF